MNFDKDLSARQEARTLAKQAEAAQKSLAQMTQAQLDAIKDDIADAAKAAAGAEAAAESAQTAENAAAAAAGSAKSASESEAAAKAAQTAAEKARDEAQDIAGGNFATIEYVDEKIASSGVAIPIQPDDPGEEYDFWLDSDEEVSLLVNATVE